MNECGRSEKKRGGYAKRIYFSSISPFHPVPPKRGPIAPSVNFLPHIPPQIRSRPKKKFEPRSLSFGVLSRYGMDAFDAINTIKRPMAVLLFNFHRQNFYPAIPLIPFISNAGCKANRRQRLWFGRLAFRSGGILGSNAKAPVQSPSIPNFHPPGPYTCSYFPCASSSSETASSNVGVWVAGKK